MTSVFLLDFRMSWEQTQFVSDPPEPGAPPELPQLSRCSLHVHADDMWSCGSFAQVEQKQQNRETSAPHVCGSTWRLTADKERWRHSWSALTCSHIRWEWNRIRAETFSNVSASVPTGSVLMDAGSGQLSVMTYNSCDAVVYGSEICFDEK